jgi:hypothetical protein
LDSLLLPGDSMRTAVDPRECCTRAALMKVWRTAGRICAAVASFCASRCHQGPPTARQA